MTLTKRTKYSCKTFLFYVIISGTFDVIPLPSTKTWSSSAWLKLGSGTSMLLLAGRKKDSLWKQPHLSTRETGKCGLYCGKSCLRMCVTSSIEHASNITSERQESRGVYTLTPDSHYLRAVPGEVLIPWHFWLLFCTRKVWTLEARKSLQAKKCRCWQSELIRVAIMGGTLTTSGTAFYLPSCWHTIDFTAFLCQLPAIHAPNLKC